MYSPWIVSSLLVLCLLHMTNGQLYYQPEQIHLSYGDVPTTMVVTWVTFDNTTTSEVQFGAKALSSVAKGIMELFTDGGSSARKIFMHRVNVTGLVPGTTYRYRVGSTDYGWSALYTFTAMPASGTVWSPRFAVYGDMGNRNAQSLPRIQTETENGNFDFILHVGDFAYNMDTNNASVGDEFMRQISSIASYVPYMTCVGNHENAYNFSNYKYRFSMPYSGGDGRNMWYSFNVGPIHFIAWDTEAYYYTDSTFGTQQIFNQYKWLEQDLIEANKLANRALRPWIITLGHRPMYCSNSDDTEHCVNPMNVARIGDQAKGWPGLEDLFYKYGVDLEFAAHEHSYERFFPVYNLRVCNGSKTPYTNPTGPVHIVTGSAGCQEGEDPFFPIAWPWSAFKSDDYGYNRFQVFNATHLYMDYVSDDKDGKVLDTMWLIKDKHGPGQYTCNL